MTDTEKVALCKSLIEEFWDISNESLEQHVVLLNCLTTVLEFKPLEDESQNDN